ncbi:type II secretion system F family protein [Alkaliphilus sp. MSJ-5]|uniref:Type II secretion system F family protein n=1 Tax=Alkaliphilus flagellatus TaxID=2841507 RepID=A0ABS6G532_9FIRM|nr:type II secretion system F family protein [Alkaliphilus flagellatus]MBU5677592.1 type II secretion system F family protein [Alkaliphilus flagellatus]
MPLYEYKAITDKGESLSGTYEAVNENEVIAMLRQSRHYPMKVKETVKKNNILDISIFKSVKIKDLAIFCRQFYTMLNAGIPIINCLEVLKVQTENKKLKNTLDDVYDDIQKGAAFSTSLKNHKKVFPDLLVNMIEAGELSGNLDSILERMSFHYEKENKIANKIKAAMVYPLMLSTVSILVVIFLLVFVMPTFLSMFEKTTLPVPTRALLFVSYSLTSYWYVYTIGLILFILGFSQLYESERGKLFFDRLKFKIPVVKGATQKVVTSRFTRTLSTLLASGIPLIQALESTAKVSGNRVVELGMREVIDEISMGVTLTNSIKKIGVFPPMVISMIQIGEDSGQLDDILDKTANFYDEETESALQKMTTMIEPLMIIIMAIIIGLIVIAMILPMFDMINTISF